MSSSFSDNFNNFLPETFLLPENEEEFKIKLYQYLNEIALAINSKDSGLYVSEETITGRQFIPTTTTSESTNFNYRDVFRVTINTGILPNSGTSAVAHGITTDQNFSIVSLYGAATRPGGSTLMTAIPLPYVNTTTPGDSVDLSMDATNINITTTTANWIVYIRSFVVIEYIKEV